MTSATNLDTDLTPFPDHTQLPESDGTFVKNFQEHPQSILITDSIKPVLQKRHPDGQYCIGQDSGIYWRMTDPPEKGAEAPEYLHEVYRRGLRGEDDLRVQICMTFQKSMFCVTTAAILGLMPYPADSEEASEQEANKVYLEKWMDRLQNSQLLNVNK